MDWSTLGPPLIIALVPIAVAGAKKIIPATLQDRFGILLPVLATALGPVFDQVLGLLTAHQADPKRGLLYGMAGIALRELVDQGRQLRRPPAAVTKAVAVVLLLAACKTGGEYVSPTLGVTGHTLGVTGHTLVGVGQQFVSVAGAYTRTCLAPAPTPTGKVAAFCDGFKRFAPEFQRDFPLATQAWKAAVQANDVKAAQAAEATIVDVATSLAALAAQVVTAVGEGGVSP